MRAESCDGTIVLNGTNKIIVDSNNKNWTIDNWAKVMINGENASYSEGVRRIVYWKKTVYQQNYETNWWGWENNGWRDASQPELAYLNNMEDCISTPSLTNRGN